MKAKIHSVKYNFIMNFILTATQFVFPLITFPYVSRVLGAAANGRVAFAASIANYFMMVASLGIPTYGIRACAQVRNDRERLSKTVKEIFFINSITTVGVTTTYIICIFSVPQFDNYKTLLIINGINIVLNMFGMNWVFQALEQYDYITLRSIFFKVVSIFCMFLFVKSPDDYLIYGGISVLAAVGSYVLNFIRVHRYVDFSVRGPYEIKKHLKPIFILFAQSLAVSIYTNLDTVMLGLMKSDVDVGYYHAAIKIKTILISLVSSLGSVLLPRMSFYAKEQMLDEFKRMMLKALNFTMLMAIPLSVYFFLYGKESIVFLAGEEYIGAVVAMQLITIAVIPNGLTGVLGIQVLTAIEREKCVLISVVVGALADFLLNLFLIPKFGSGGAALATTVAEFIVAVVQIYYTRSLLKDIKSGFKIWGYLVFTVIAVFASFWVRNLGVNSTFIILVISATTFFGTYAVGLLVIKDEIAVEIVNAVKMKFRGKK